MKAAKRRKISFFTVLGSLFAGLMAVMVLFPFVWLFVSSFKTDACVIAWPPKFFPDPWTLSQYFNVNHSIDVLTMSKNSLIFAGCVTLISLFIDSMAAYAFARMRFKGKELLFGIILLTMMVPFQIIMTPLYIQEYKMGILNTFPGLVLPRAATAYGIYMLRSFFSGLPKSLEESARIDGLGEFRIYFQIMLPQCIPALVTLGVFHFMNNWNDLLYPLMLTSSMEMRTLSAGLAMLVGNNIIKYGPTLAATVISVLPLLILYLFGQRFFVEGVATAGMKE